MTHVTIQASPISVRLDRQSDDRDGIDRLDVTVFRGEECVERDVVKRGEMPDFGSDLTSFERSQVFGLVAVEWLQWPEKTTGEAPLSYSIFELYEQFAKLVNAKKGAAA